MTSNMKRECCRFNTERSAVSTCCDYGYHKEYSLSGPRANVDVRIKIKELNGEHSTMLCSVISISGGHPGTSWEVPLPGRIQVQVIRPQARPGPGYSGLGYSNSELAF
jgi:hypothetical protein